MNTLYRTLMLGGSTVAMVATMAGAAQAQDVSNEQVIVSASRINIAGYQQPTPVTVVGIQSLERDAKTSIGDAIRELPSVGSSDSPSNGSHAGDAGQGDAGIDTINLRTLGVLRTLVLFDGQRVVNSNPNNGGVDLSTIPSSLVQRVDVVTGGASAAWGSDAVAGVVNLILNKNFEGFKGNLQYGDRTGGGYRQFKGEASWGTGFAGDRGHVVLSGTYTMTPDALFNGEVPWWHPRTLLLNSAVNGVSTPTYVHTSNYGSAQYTEGGLITASAAGGAANISPAAALAAGSTAVFASAAASNALRGTQFVGERGTPVAFNLGTGNFGGTNPFVSSSGACYNCSANQYSGIDSQNLTAVPYRNTTLFGYVSYKLSDTIRASLQLNYGQNFEQNRAAQRQSNITAKYDNPFLDTGLRDRLIAGGVTSFTLGVNNFNNSVAADDYRNITIRDIYNELGGVYNANTRVLMRGVFTLEGSLGNDWSWNAYAQHSQIREQQHNPNNTLTANYNRAIDAVRASTTDQTNYGVAAGSIVCRDQVSATAATRAAAAGCVPLNIFGNGVVSEAARNYVQPGRYNVAVQDQSHYFLNQDVFAASAQGVLPWELPAGKVAVAFGAEYRHEQQRNVGDPLGIGTSAGWGSGNYTSYAAQYNVMEGFAEVNVPLIKDGFVQSLEFNAAGRITSYSNSGQVQTWKLGVTSQVNDDVRLRTTWSTDIRAPVISELFAPPQYNQSAGTVDPKTKNSVPIFYTAQGNPLLKPEVANTISGGIVLTPTFIDNLSMSLDWYSITIKKAVFVADNNAVLAQCAANPSSIYCGQIFYNDPRVPLQVNQAVGTLNLITNIPQNAATEFTSGLDFQADYKHELFSGVMNWRVLGNYTDAHNRTQLGVVYSYAGQLSSDNAGGAAATAPAKFHATISASYGQGNWEGTVQTRLTGSARLVNAWASGVNVDDNSVPFIALLDLRTQYKWNDNLRLYAAIDNVMDIPPPNIAIFTNGTGNSSCTNYDCLGRKFRVGIRVSY